MLRAALTLLTLTIAAQVPARADIPQNVRVVRGYDVLDRETSVNFPGAAPDINRTYDANSNVVDVLRGNVWSYDYNELDQITGETLNIDGGTYAFVYDYGTDGALRGRDNMHSGAAWRFDPDALGRPQSARIDAVNYVGSVDYHPNGLIADAAYLNGYLLDQTLNARQLPDALKTTKSGQPNAVWLSYSYDPRRKISAVSDLDGTAANESRIYGYDANGRLVSASGPWGQNGANATGSFKYDALGNIREQKLGTRTIAIAYDAAANRVSSATDGATVRNYFYADARGNATRIQIGGVNRDFTYDHSNQPTAVSGSATATYVYDGNLKRVKEVRGGKTIYNVFSKVTGGLIYRFDDATGTANDIRTDYVNVGGAALRLKKTGGGAAVPEYTHFDSQGSAVAATNAAGTVTWRERYAPYGEELLNPALNADNTAYTGHLKDDATGLNYMQARYYDPIIGRFLSTDPIGYRDQLNLYAYVANDPVNNIDPTGECSSTFSGSSTLCGIEDALTRVLTPIVEGAMELAGVDVVPEGERDPGGLTSHSAPEQSAAAEAAAIGAVAAGAVVDRTTGGRKGGDVPASTPTGSRGSPMDVASGTNAPGQIGDREFTGHAFDQMQGRGVPPSAVENAIANGARSPGREAGETVFTDRTNGVRVVTTPTGAIKTVITVDRDK